MENNSKKSIWSSILNTRILICIFTGFTSGMPLYVLFQMIPAWLRDTGVDIETIGLLSLVSFPYTWKFLWSPLTDRIVPPFLGRRRGWALLTQVGLLISLMLFGLFEPQTEIWSIAAVVGLVALFSASQDIVLDAYRREILPDEELGFGNSMFVNAYRLSSLVPGSLALILADQIPWSQVHIVVAVFMLIGIATTWFMPEPTIAAPPPKSFKSAVVEPFREFFQRKDTKSAIGLLSFILLYKLGDNMATALATPFYLDLGFTKTEIGTVAKVAALWSSIAGGTLGGIVMIKIGINRSLWVFGFIQLITIFGFAALSEIGANRTWLFIVVSAEYLGVGLGTAAFVAFMAKSTDTRYTATQLALLTSLMGVPRTIANASTGFIIASTGYTTFFIICGILAIPGMVLLYWVAPWSEAQS
ncbi:MAG: AmpG family muropeptide MFS transporter [Myxococcota bacterium]|nr:AmpG family muropeptide MFS transporter [Myxococcota bacterium]